MPNNAALGYTMSATENASYQGLYTILAETAVSALPAGPTNQIPAAVAQGMMLLVRVWNHTATGTITVAGTTPYAGGALSRTTTTIQVANQNEFAYKDYWIPDAYATVTASTGISVTGLTNGRVVIYGINAPNQRLMAGEFKIMEKRDDKVIVQQRGTYAEAHQPAVPLKLHAEWEFQSDFQPDSNYLLVPTGVNSTVTSASLPASPTALLAATSCVSSGTSSLTSQPTTPGMVLKLTIAGGPASAATVSVTGTISDGETVTEVIVQSTKINGVWYSNNVFTAVAANGVSFGSFGGSATVQVDGIFGVTQTASMGQEGSPTTTAFYQFDGVASKVVPFGYTNSWELAGGMDKEDKLAMKGWGQLVGLVGDTTTGAQQGPALVQSLDLAAAGWETTVYIDAVSSGNPAGTTQFLGLREHKIACDLHIEPRWTSAFVPPNRYFSRIKKGRHTIEAELTVDMLAAEYDQLYRAAFQQGQRLNVQIWRRHQQAICTIAGTPSYLGCKINMVLLLVEDPQLDYQIGQPDVSLKLKGKLYYDANQGYDLQAVWVTRRPQW